ncbi:centrosome-associated protein CEP250-like isoform X3 [Strix uralensis]|uniref:centrosome-associated protein CEP250-like isoform X3 n=1 Tax=Strix uralensis TaxID=36305 RepID=UPI003DA298DC
MRRSGSVLVNCSHLNSGVQLWEPVSLGRPVLKGQAQQQAGQETSQKTWEVMPLQVKGDLEKKELQDRGTELSALLVQSQKQNEEKEKTVKTLNDTVEILEASRLEKEYEASLTKSVKEENLSLQKLIKDITEVVLDECASVVADSSQQAESSNVLSCLSSVDAERAFVLVQEALARRRGATQAPKEELSARQDSISFLLHQHRQQEEKCRKLQQSLEQLEQECQTASSHQQHLQSLVEAFRSDCANLEKIRAELQQQLEETEQEASRLHQSNTELQLREDAAQGERVEQQQRMERARRDQELLLKDLAALEEKHSLLESELVVARETLEESHLQRDLLRQEKHELTMALEKAEQSVAELRGAQNKLSAEVAVLHVAAAKMSSVSEALALDKVRLNKLVSQLEQENEVLSGKVAELEKVRISDQEKLSLCERTNEELSAEKAHLEQLLKKVEEQREGLQVELRILAEEKAETKSSSVRSVKETLESSLFEAQQHLSQLEITRSQLEIQLHTVTQAKEVIQGEVKCLQCELEAERSLMRQEQENMAQQLLQTEQQCNNTLKLQQADQEVEINQLLQDLVLQEKEHEKSALLETLLQPQGELREANQQLEQLRQEVKEQHEDGQNITEKLQAELQETQSKIKAVEKRHKEEIKIMKEEINVLLQQRDALQNQVEELTSQLAASKESQQVIGHKAQQDPSEAQELSRQKVLEVVHVQKIREEKRSQWEKVEHQNKELQVCLQSLEGERS